MLSALCIESPHPCCDLFRRLLPLPHPPLPCFCLTRMFSFWKQPLLLPRLLPSSSDCPLSEEPVCLLFKLSQDELAFLPLMIKEP